MTMMKRGSPRRTCDDSETLTRINPCERSDGKRERLLGHTVRKDRDPPGFFTLTALAFGSRYLPIHVVETSDICKVLFPR